MPGNARVTIMFTDLVGSTALLERLGDRAAAGVLRRHFGILRKAVVVHGGREVKSLGDGVMVVFSAPASAVACAAAMQRGIARYNVTSGAELGLRIGLHSGDALHDGSDYVGMPVVIAKRLCDLCGPGQVTVSAAVAGTVSPGAHTFDELGALALKGISAPVGAAALRWTSSGLHAVPESHDARRLLVG